MVTRATAGDDAPGPTPPLDPAAYEADFRAAMRRLTARLGAYLALAGAGTYAAAATGVSPQVPFLTLTGIVAISAAYAGAQAWRTGSLTSLRSIELNHLMVWASTVLVGMVCVVIWVLGGQGVPEPGIAWLMSGVGVIGWVVAHSRYRYLISREPTPSP